MRMRVEDIDMTIQPFNVAWRTIDGLNIRYATGGKGGEKVVLLSTFQVSDGQKGAMISSRLTQWASSSRRRSKRSA